MKWMIAVVVTAMLVGCGGKQIEYVDRVHNVDVPVKCTVAMPNGPEEYSGVAGVKALAKYADRLECALRLCRGEKCDD